MVQQGHIFHAGSHHKQISELLSDISFLVRCKGNSTAVGQLREWQLLAVINDAQKVIIIC